MPSATETEQSQALETEPWVSVSSTPTEPLSDQEVEEEEQQQLPTPAPTPPRVRFEDGDVLTTPELYARIRELEQELDAMEESLYVRSEEHDFDERVKAYRAKHNIGPEVPSLFSLYENKENIPPSDYIKQETVDETCFDAGTLLSQLEMPRHEDDIEDRVTAVRSMRKKEPRMRKAPNPSKKWVMSRIYPKRFRGTVWKGERTLSHYGQVGLAAIDDAIAIHAREMRELISDRQFVVRWAS